MKQIEDSIRNMLNDDSSYMYPLLAEYMKRGGKRLRPAILVVSTAACNGKTENAIEPAAVLELFHNFTLVHDDICDDSLLRRGKNTMHVDHGIPIALTAGDALYTIVFKYLISLNLPESKLIELSKLYSECFKKVVEGQSMELKWYNEKNADVSQKEYFDMILNKTGILLGCACETGALLAGKEEFRKPLKEFGEKLGIAFQIKDDVLNIVGEEEKYKKEIGGDITEGKRTLMLVYALTKLTKNEKEQVIRILLSHTRKKEEIDFVIEKFKSTGAVDFAMDKAKSLIDEAKKILKVIPDSKYKEALLEIADFVLLREH